jgi:predicted lipid-binding transport protein (Tim44 family)
LRASKSHYIRLQAAWDKADMQDIREYTTPELFAELTLERQQPGDNDQFTEVVSLNSELLGVATEGDRVVASVRYTGLIRETRDAEPHAFSEVWHVQRALNEPDAAWYVAGIQQDNLPA